MNAAILLVARDNPVALWAQIEALVGCDLAEDVEVVVVDDASGPEVQSLLARLEGDVTIHRSDRPVGRRTALTGAARAASANVCIALGSNARPRPGFVEPLVAAVRAGAVLAAPVLETGAGDVYGYRAAADGSLWPVTAPGDAVDALGVDCLAAAKSWWTDRQPLFGVREGHHELLTAAAAGGGLAVVAESRVGRASCGPAASVILCTRDRPDEVSECVAACTAHGVLADGGEIVVVDNGVTPLEIELGPHVRVVREPIAGLSRARNAGARVAANDLLVYLDDDARPAPGWIESLRDAFCDPRVVIAGGPIYPLWPAERPAGWPAAGLESFFGGLSLGDADFEFPGRAEVYGGNWGVRRAILDAVGGFDVQFGAGEGGSLGGEEFMAATHVHRLGLGDGRYVTAAGVGHRIEADKVDEGYMALRAFRNGVETVRYEQTPADIAIDTRDECQLAGETADQLAAISAADIPLEARIRQAVDLGMRAAREAPGSDLARGRVTPPARRVPRRSGPPGERESVLFFYPDMPEPSRSAGHTRASEIAFALRRLGYRTTLACETSTGYEAAAERFAGSGIEVAATDRGDDLDALLRRGFDAAIVSFHTLAARAVPVLRAVTPRTRIAVDSVDVHFVRMRRAAELAGDQVAVVRADHGRAQELAVYAAADVVLAVTEDERALLAGLLPGADVQVLGNVHRVAETVAPLAGRRGSLFVGSYGHAPNADAVRWLCADVMPLLHAAGHENPVVVAGANMPDDLAALASAAGAQPRGFLPSMDAELAARRISIAPLRFGAGLKGKVGESLAAGVPVVGTTIAAEGFARPERGMLIADTAAEFADAMMRLEADDGLWAKLSAGGRELVSETLGLGACEAALERILGGLLARRAA
ncbi:MAG TPA: glycosyltransferase [Gaiellales bacterium]|nr:glycosyltransferase [Gaiellales bacterium]